MRIIFKLSSLFSSRLAIILFASIFSCSPDLRDAAIPFKPFSPLVLNLNLPENIALKTDGGIRVLSNSEAGFQGVIVYRKNTTTYIAYERNCSYHPNDACATVDVHSSRLYMQDPCCGSTFRLDTGDPTGGPAWRPLRQYETHLSGSDLTITDVVIE